MVVVSDYHGLGGLIMKENNKIKTCTLLSLLWLLLELQIYKRGRCGASSPYDNVIYFLQGFVSKPGLKA